MSQRFHCVITFSLAWLVVGAFCGCASRVIPNHNVQEVLDCSNPPACHKRLLQNNIKDCIPWTTDCTFTREGLADITFVADAANYVPFPFTRETFTVTLIDVHLDKPWDIEFLPDQTLLLTERDGRIVHVRENAREVMWTVEPISFSGSGLLGLAIDPDFDSNRYVYVLYNYKFADGPLGPFKEWISQNRRTFSRISRLRLGPGRLDNEAVLLDEIPGSLLHSGGRLEFGPDGKLYATTGYAGERRDAQEPAFLGGKILRLNPDGTIPSDNPFPGSPVYSMGHRNPQGLAWHPTTHKLYASEHGPWRYDEINLIRAGQNYGWGTYKCNETNDFSAPGTDAAVEPIFCTKSWTLAPSGMEFVSDPKSPWFGNLFVAALRGKHVHRYVFENLRLVGNEIFFVSGGQDYITESIRGKIDARIRDVKYHAGSLYVIGENFGLVKITPK